MTKSLKVWKVNWSTWHEFPTEVEPMTSRTLGGHSIYWATRSHGQQGPWVLVAPWIEHLPGVQEVMGSISVRDWDFVFVPRRLIVLISSLLTFSPRPNFSLFPTFSQVCFPQAYFLWKVADNQPCLIKRKPLLRCQADCSKYTNQIKKCIRRFMICYLMINCEIMQNQSLKY